MKFIAALIGAWLIGLLTQTFRIGTYKTAKNYKELMEKESFKQTREQEQEG